MTSSCTHALETAALLLDVGVGDEVILPSFTFVSTANAFALRGAKPVFADISADTLNVDPDSVASLMTDRTRGLWQSTTLESHATWIGSTRSFPQRLSRSWRITLMACSAPIGESLSGRTERSPH